MEFLTTQEVARQLNAPEATIRAWCAQGKFPGAWKPSRRSTWLIPASTLDKFVKPKRGRPLIEKTKQPRRQKPRKNFKVQGIDKS